MISILKMIEKEEKKIYYFMNPFIFDEKARTSSIISLDVVCTFIIMNFTKSYSKRSVEQSVIYAYMYR